MCSAPTMSRLSIQPWAAMILRDPSHSFGMTSPGAMSLHANVFPEKGRNVQVLAFDDGRFAFLETSARDRLELHNFLLRLDAFFLWRLRLFFYNRFFLWWNQTRGGLFT